MFECGVGQFLERATPRGRQAPATMERTWFAMCTHTPTGGPMGVLQKKQEEVNTQVVPDETHLTKGPPLACSSVFQGAVRG